jgi:hypothetical protein
MIEVERASPLALACLPVGRNATALDWLALLKTSAEINAALCPLGAAFEVSVMTHPTKPSCVVASSGGSFIAARRYINWSPILFPKSNPLLHVAFMSHGVPKSWTQFWTQTQKYQASRTITGGVWISQKLPKNRTGRHSSALPAIALCDQKDRGVLRFFSWSLSCPLQPSFNVAANRLPATMPWLFEHKTCATPLKGPFKAALGPIPAVCFRPVEEGN